MKGGVRTGGGISKRSTRSISIIKLYVKNGYSI